MAILLNELQGDCCASEIERLQVTQCRVVSSGLENYTTGKNLAIPLEIEGADVPLEPGGPAWGLFPRTLLWEYRQRPLPLGIWPTKVAKMGNGLTSNWRCC